MNAVCCILCREGVIFVVSLNGIGNVQLSLGNPDVKRVITTYMSRLTNFIEDELGTTN